jgi:signal transduction histidine kinase
MAGAFRLSRKITQVQVRERRKIGISFSPPDSGCDAALSLKQAAAQTRMYWARGEDLQLSVQPAMLMIHESVLGAVVAELLDNTFRYSRAGAVVHLLGKSTGENYEISVQAQGPGLIPERLVDFEVPLPPDPASGTLWGGITGVRYLLESCNIKLEVDSAPGSRTTVRFTVPCMVPSGPRSEVRS